MALEPAPAPSDADAPHTADADTPLALPASRIPDPRTAPPIRWGIVSPGGIARTFTGALHRGTSSRVVAVASRSQDRAEAFAAEHTIGADGERARAYDSVAAMLAAGGLDAVYIASPHAQHHQAAREVLEAGVPVLVEKAFTLNSGQASELFELARARQVFCMEAMWTRFLPQMDVLAQVIETGLLGEIVSVRADHGQRFAFDPAHRLYAPELGGGALLDLGVYPISFAQALLGDLRDVAVRGELTATGVDASAAIVARGRDGARALLDTTLRAALANDAWVQGTEGRVHLDGWFYTPTTMHVQLADGRSAEYTHPGAAEDAMAYEAAEVARRVLGGDLESPVMSWADTLSVVGTMDTVRSELGVVYPGEEVAR